jgi:hypothetical protein
MAKMDEGSGTSRAGTGRDWVEAREEVVEYGVRNVVANGWSYTGIRLGEVGTISWCDNCATLLRSCGSGNGTVSCFRRLGDSGLKDHQLRTDLPVVVVSW